MRKILMISAIALLVASCTTTDTTGTKKTNTKSPHITGVYNFKSSDKKLTKNLIKMSKHFNKPVNVTSSCRTKAKNRGAKNSYHLYSRGCKAADINMRGVKGSTLLKWWTKNVGGGRGSYSCRNFVHVDVGPTRSWHWNLCKGKRRK